MRPQIILGPPGTGKTTRGIREVENELGRGVSPDRIGYVTFTTRGAEEAKSRACERFSLQRDDLPYFRTIHSLCFRQLGMSRGDVLEGKRLKEFAKYAGVRITGRVSEDGVWTGYDTGDRIMFIENLARIRQVPLRAAYDVDDDTLSWNEVDRVSKALRKFKKANGLRDFTDMLTEFVDTGITLDLEVLIVDEAQDLSALQWKVIGQLARGVRRLIVCGDDDQAIYRWAGADADHLIDMEGEVEVLGQSWRVPLNIQVVANEIIGQVHKRRPKEWSAREGSPGLVARAASFGEVDCGSGEVLVLARNGYVIKDQVEPELRRQGIVYEVNGNPSVKASTLEVIQDWESLRAGRSVLVASVREIYKHMTVGKGFARGFKSLPNRPDDEETTLSDLVAHGGLLTGAIWHEALDRLPEEEVAYITAARRRGEKLLQRPRVRLSTIHGSKGGEAEHVVLFKEMARRTYGEMTHSNGEDEARVWYVGVTRAKDRLTIVESNTRQECPWL
jgi:DNA helicase-2/ATP-dependent DNA helicase PcrA